MFYNKTYTYIHTYTRALKKERERERCSTKRTLFCPLVKITLRKIDAQVSISRVKPSMLLMLVPVPSSYAKVYRRSRETSLIDHSTRDKGRWIYARIRGSASAVFQRPSNGTKPTIFSRRAKLMREMKRRYIIKQRLLFRRADARKFLTSPSTRLRVSAVAGAASPLPRLRRNCPQKSRILNTSL